MDLPALFERVIEKLLALHPEDTRCKMLHQPGVRVGEKCYVFAMKAHIALKLPAERVAALIASGAGEPVGTSPKRPMREWVRVPPSTVASAVKLANEARAFVSSLSP